MTSSGISPKAKRLKLLRKVDEDEHKNSEENAEVEAKKKNFMKTCLKVSYEAYQDFKKRFQLIYVPECINNICSHGDRNVNIRQISQSAEHCFKTEFKNSTWYDALEICLVCTTSSQYLSANVLMDIVEIMMNAHEDLDTGFQIDYLLKKCQHTLIMHFNMHPPCVRRDIRDCYKKFLTSPMDPKELSNRKVYLSDEGIVSHCCSRLIYEINVDSKDGTLIEEQEIPAEIEGVKRLHWKKENLELFELLVRRERIERCMLILETVIYLLQTDIALWHARSSGTHGGRRSQKPLLAYILWPNNSLTHGTVTPLCLKIMELFAYYIHLQYPERHIKTMALWMNAVVQMFYMYDRHPDVDYPNTSQYCSVFAKRFYKIISDLPNISILKILGKIQPYFMQYLVGIYHIQSLLDYTQGDILNIIIWCVNSMSWDNYVKNEEPTICIKSRLKPHKLMDYLSRKCRRLNCAINVVQDCYPKLEFTKKDNQIRQNYLIDILFATFVAYLETYSVKNFNQTLESFNENKNNFDPVSYKSYSVRDHFVKQYRSIIKSLQELLIILKNKQDDDEPSKKLSELINIYFS